MSKSATSSAENGSEMFEQQLRELVPDEGLFDYLVEAVHASSCPEDFNDVAVPIFMDLGDLETEEEATAMASRLFEVYTHPPPPQEEATESAPIVMSDLLSEAKVIDPFEEEKIAQARKMIEDNERTDQRTSQPLGPVQRDDSAMKDQTERLLGQMSEENAQFRSDMTFRRSEDMKTPALYLQDINVFIGANYLLEDAQLTLMPGNRYGLVGRNGIGKTTFMRYMNSSLLRGIPEDLLIIHVQQEAPISEVSPLDSVLNTDIERTEILEALHTIDQTGEGVEKLHALNDRLSEIGGNEAVEKATMILLALGFSKEQLTSPLSSLSGGFRMRVSLAQALYINPDILLLDEPTGHLDVPSVCWLEEFLATQYHDRICIIVSHDRVFLDNVCTHVIHLKDKKLEIYKGNYTHFEGVFENKVKSLEEQSEAQQKDIDHKMDYVRRLGARAASAAMAQGRLKLISKMEKVVVIERDPPIHFEFTMSSAAAQTDIMKLEDVYFEYLPNKPIYEHLSFTVTTETRAVIIGGNGCGKSTFANLLMCKLKPQSGFVQTVSNLRVAHFSQHHVDQLDYKTTPLQYLLDQYRDQYQLADIRGTLGKFGISGERSLMPIESLSGGQKTRVVLAAIALQHPHLMILDEVTNNLDMDSIDALGKALQLYEGAIVAITHDQHFASLVGKQIFISHDRQLTEFPGSFSEYRDGVKEDIRNRFFRMTTSKQFV